MTALRAIFSHDRGNWSRERKDMRGPLVWDQWCLRNADEIWSQNDIINPDSRLEVLGIGSRFSVVGLNYSRLWGSRLVLSLPVNRVGWSAKRSAASCGPAVGRNGQFIP